MESRLPNKSRPLRTPGDVLRLTNSPATFQTMMNDIFKDLIDEGYVSVYMNDILVYTHMIEHHWEVVTRVLDML